MKAPETVRVGIIMNGVTGRMGTNQHLLRSILPMIQEGGIAGAEGGTILPDPILVGRNPDKLKALCRDTGLQDWTTDLPEALANPDYPVYFDSQLTHLRGPAVEAAIKAGKHLYLEKPCADSFEQASHLCELARRFGVKHGVVQDKLWLPGFRKLDRLIHEGFFGEILGVRGDFGYWVFPGKATPPQRPSWNYRKEEGGGIILDMVPHWQYLVENLFGTITSLSCVAGTLIKNRWDENHQPYQCTADDSAHLTLELESGVLIHINFSWVVRVRRDDLFVLQVDGTNGSAVAGLRKCWIQSRHQTPRPVWNPDLDDLTDYRDSWFEVEDDPEMKNAFRAQWELFLQHVILDTPFPWDLAQGARGVQLADLALESWKQRRWVDV